MSLVDLGKRLLEAAKQGHTEEVRTLMSNGAPFTTDWLGTSPLHFASLNGHLSTAEVLLRAGISRDARTKVDRTPLHVAAQEGHARIVELLIRNGADIEAKDMLKMTPLHWAVEKGHIAVIEVLMASGSDTTCLNKFDKNSLDIAIGNGRSDIAEILQLSRSSTVEVGTEQQVLEEVAEVQPEITIQEEVDDNIISGEAADHFSAKGGYYLNGNSINTEGEDGEQNNTAVLATLAALAEATAPRTSAAASSSSNNDAETLKWLESHGITMISADNSTLVASTLDTGQQLALTDAGKLALKSMVQQKEDEEQLVQEETLDSLGEQQVVTFMTGDGELVETSEDQGSMVVTLQPDGTLLQHDDGTGEPTLRRIKTEDGTELIISSQGGEITEEQLQQLQEGQLQEAEEGQFYEHQITLKTEKE